MPELLRLEGYRFFFYSREGEPREPPQVLVRKDGCEAKFWLTPIVRQAWNKRFDARALKFLEKAVIEYREEFEDRWNVFFT